MEELVGSDTNELRASEEEACHGGSALGPFAVLGRFLPRPYLKRRGLVSGALFLLLGSLGCGEQLAGPPVSSPPDDVERAKALLSEDAELPVRAETVALADQVAIASARAGKTEEGARLARLAADLRARLWRLDQSASDGREAVELYAAVAAAASGREEGCEADRRRALLIGEMANDASQSFRELYLVKRRQAVILDAAGALHGTGAKSQCLAQVDSALAYLAAFRPGGEAMRALSMEGNTAALVALRGMSDGGLAQVPSSGALASSPGSISSAAPSSREPGDDVVVTPSRDAVQSGPSKILSVERHASDKGARVVIHLSRPAVFSVGALAADAASNKPHRIFVDIERATAKGVPKEIGVGGAVTQIRIGAQESGTRVVLDLSAVMHKRVFYLPDPFRIVVDVSSRRPHQEERRLADGKREVRRVVLDPGHGGNDTGAVGPTGLREKDVTLDIAHRAAPVLAHEFGIDTLLTRDSDAYIPLDLRAARANAFHADLFVSIHCNASEDGLGRGVQTFYLDELRNPELSAARVAARENALLNGKKRFAEDPAEENGSAEMASVLSGLLSGDTIERSRHVAELLQRSAMSSLLSRYPDMKDQGVKTAGFYVLAGTDMPAVLFETAFISNPQEEARLASADFRQKMADAIVNAIRAYRDGK